MEDYQENACYGIKQSKRRTSKIASSNGFLAHRSRRSGDEAGFQKSFREGT